MAWIKVDWTEIQSVMDEPDFDEHCVGTEQAGVYLVDEDWLYED